MSVIGPGTPYLTPSMLTNMPLGISWSTIPTRNATVSQQIAAQMDACQVATGQVDGFCNAVLRCTANVEEVSGPNYLVTIDNNTGETRVLTSRPPVTQVTGVSVANGATYPRQWQALPAGMFEPERPMVGVYGTSSPSDSGEGGQAVRIAPGYVSWANGRNGFRVRVSYTNGWPHCGLTASSAPGATTLAVDDCTGWAPVTAGGQGATGIIFDGAVQEAVTCLSASATAGPGVLTLTNPTGYGHPTGALLSTLPGNVRWATALFAAAQALTRGSTATTVQSVSPGKSSSKGPAELMDEARKQLQPFRRVI